MMSTCKPIGLHDPDLGDSMSRSSLVRHKYAHAPRTILGYRKNGMPIFPIAGAEDGDKDGGADGGDGGQSGDGSDKTGGEGGKPDPAPGDEAVDDKGNKLGFPVATPTEQMTADQRAAYWRHQAKVQQSRVPKNLDDLLAKAQKWDDFEKEQQTPAQRAIEEARAEGRKAAAADTAMASLRVILSERGKTEEEVSGLLAYVSPQGFLTTDGSVDHQKVTTYANTIAPAKSSTPLGGFGNGRFESTATSAAEAGKAEAQRRFAKK